MRQWKIGELFGVKFTVSCRNYGAVNTMCHGNGENHVKRFYFHSNDDSNSISGNSKNTNRLRPITTTTTTHAAC